MTLDAATRHPTTPIVSLPDHSAAAGRHGQTLRDLLDAVFGGSDEATVIVDDVGDITYVTAGTSVLLGYDRRAAIGRSVFDFVHPADVAGAADLFVRRLRFAGSDLGAKLRIVHAGGTIMTMLATARVLPPGPGRSGIGSCAIRLRVMGATEIDRELSLRRRIVVTGYTNALGIDLMAAPGSGEILARVEVALDEIALLSGADSVVVCLERPNRDGLDILASSQPASSGPIHISDDDRNTQPLLREHLAVDSLSDRRPELVNAFGVRAHALLSTPFTAGARRGAIVLLRLEPGRVWWDTDSELVRGVATVISRALHTAWSEGLLTLSYRNGPIAFSIHDWHGELIDCNDRYCELFGLDRSPALDVARSSSKPDPGPLALTDIVDQLRSGSTDRLDLEVEYERSDGETIWVRTSCVRLGLPGSTDSVVLTSYSDITSRRRQRLELEYAASHDALTGAVNRTSLRRTIEAMQEADGHLPTLLIIDLDRFKDVNDTYGHHIGDLVLQSVVRRLRANVRAEDVVARLGGDEFAIGLRGRTLAEAEAAADRLRVAAEEPIHVEGRTITQTLSIGVAVGSDCDELADLMVRADRALYAAKHRGRNCQVVFQPTMNEEALPVARAERRLHATIGNGELDG